MKINKHLKELIEKAVSESFDKTGKVNPKTVERFTQVFEKLPVSKSIPALNEYTHGLKRVISETTLTIETSLPLSKTDAQKITKLLEKHYPLSQTQTNLNPQLLGGIRLKIGDLVLDDSVNGKIEKIGEVING